MDSVFNKQEHCYLWADSSIIAGIFFIICTYIFKNFYDSLLFFPQGKEKKKHNKVLLHKPYLYFSGNLGVKLFYSEKK